MGKRNSSLTEGTVDTLVTQLLDLIDKGPQGDILAQQLLQWKSRLLTKGDGEVQKPARDFTLEEVVESFELNFRDGVSAAAPDAYRWKIEDEKLDFPMTPCIGNLSCTFLQSCIVLMDCFATASLVENYSKNFDRSSEAVCRTALDFMLNECLTVLVSRALLFSNIAHELWTISERQPCQERSSGDQ
jgi:hypothetical protein